MKNKLKNITIRDFTGIFIFLLMIIPSIIFKWYLHIKHKRVWLICETRNTARDNGAFFYKYMKAQHPEVACYYAINKNCTDYEYVKEYGDIIEWNSLKHYLLFMCADVNISSHKEGNPNHPLFSFLLLKLGLYNNRVFLQHGVLFQDFVMFHQNNCKFKLFITGALPEYKFVKEKYGYTKEVIYTGLARFDNLHDNIVRNGNILYIPTWRRWINTEDDLIASTYYKGIMELLNSTKLEELLNRYKKKFIFYPHYSTQRFMKKFSSHIKGVKILDVSLCNVQEILKSGCILITDFSSISVDFAYMNKPIIYYEYDKEEFYNGHFPPNTNHSYFDFSRDGFGIATSDIELVIEKLNEYLKNGCIPEDVYLSREKAFFPLHDKNNCERIFKAVNSLKR